MQQLQQLRSRVDAARLRRQRAQQTKLDGRQIHRAALPGGAPGDVVHLQAGLRGCWINREAATWTHPQLQPDLQFDTLTGLADWLDANLDAAAPRST